MNKLKIKTDKNTSELSKTLYNVVGEKFPIEWSRAEGYAVAETSKELTEEQVSQFLQESNSSLARPIRGDLLSDSSRTGLKEDIKNIQDSATKAALEDIYHILTGESL